MREAVSQSEYVVLHCLIRAAQGASTSRDLVEHLQKEPYNRREEVDVGYVSLILHRLERKGWLTVHAPPRRWGKQERGRPGPEYRCSVSLEELIGERALEAVRQVTLGDPRSLELFREALRGLGAP